MGRDHLKEFKQNAESINQMYNTFIKNHPLFALRDVFEAAKSSKPLMPINCYKDVELAPVTLYAFIPKFEY